MIKFLNILFFAGMVVMNYLANALPLNGKNTGELSDAFPNLFVPAGITFSIWGVIYLLLLLVCIIQFSGSTQATIIQINWLFIFSCVLNALWIVFWHYGKLPLSLLVMLGLLVSLIFINIRLTGSSNMLIKATFGIYLGWICIATIANVTALLVHYNWNGFGISGEIWTILMIIIGMVITILAIRKFNNPWMGFSVVWAFAGIIIKRQTDFRSIALVAIIAALCVAAMAVFSFFRKSTIG
ncbi:MAG TPA: tryptophan-rich sensory protein [Prolixibacteraceae bacterium]|nr:tryptophan-rich sensory protein [Prolixibacteraceae bacterium]